MLICGIFIYLTGASIASVMSIFIQDASILMNAVSIFTLILKEFSYYLIFIVFVYALGKLVFKKVSVSDFSFTKLMWRLILIYFLVQFISFVYTAWGYDVLGIDFIEKTDEYYIEIRGFYDVQLFISAFRFSPFIFCPMILLYFGKKLKN